MAHANAIFLSLLSGGALVLALVPGCSNSTAQPAVALAWEVKPGPFGAGMCGAVDDTFSIGSTNGNIVTASNGTNYSGDGGPAPPLSVQCTVSPDSGGFSVQAQVQYGNIGTLTIDGQINVSGSGKPGTQMGITGSFSDGLGLAGASMTDNNCTVTFTQAANMGIAATRIWGFIDCQHESNTNGNSEAQNCEGSAEFLFENCGQ